MAVFFRKENGFTIQKVQDIDPGIASPANTYDMIFILGNTGSPELNELRRIASVSSPTCMLTIIPDIELLRATPEFIHHPQEGRLLVEPQTFIPSAARTIHDLFMALEGEGLIGIDLGDLMTITVQRDLHPFFADITDLRRPAEETVPAAMASGKGPLEKLKIEGLFGTMVFDGHVVEGGNFYSLTLRVTCCAAKPCRDSAADIHAVRLIRLFGSAV